MKPNPVIYFRDMDDNEFKRINELINDTLQTMTPAQRFYHDVKVGIQYRNLLNDYNWDRRIFEIPVEQMTALQQVAYDASNIECRIPIWLDKWDNFNYASADPVTRETFEKEATLIRYNMALHMKDHPVNGRIIRWVMSVFDEETRTFHYERVQPKQL